MLSDRTIEMGIDTLLDAYVFYQQKSSFGITINQSIDCTLHSHFDSTPSVLIPQRPLIGGSPNSTRSPVLRIESSRLERVNVTANLHI